MSPVISPSPLVCASAEMPLGDSAFEFADFSFPTSINVNTLDSLTNASFAIRNLSAFASLSATLNGGSEGNRWVIDGISGDEASGPMVELTIFGVASSSQFLFTDINGIGNLMLMVADVCVGCTVAVSGWTSSGYGNAMLSFTGLNGSSVTASDVSGSESSFTVNTFGALVDTLISLSNVTIQTLATTCISTPSHAHSSFVAILRNVTTSGPVAFGRGQSGVGDQPYLLFVNSALRFEQLMVAVTDSSPSSGLSFIGAWLVNTSIAVVGVSVSAPDGPAALDFPSLRLLEGSALLVADCNLTAQGDSLRIALSFPPTGEALNPDGVTYMYAHGHSDEDILGIDGAHLVSRGIDRSIPSSVTISRNVFNAPSAASVALTNASFGMDTSNIVSGTLPSVAVYNAPQGLDWALVAQPPDAVTDALKWDRCTFVSPEVPPAESDRTASATKAAVLSHSLSPSGINDVDGASGSMPREENAAVTHSLSVSHGGSTASTADPSTVPAPPLGARSTLDGARLSSYSSGGFAFFGDPLEVKLAAVILAGPCASGADRSMGRASRYLLSPFIDLGAAAVGIAHFATVVAVLCAHAAIAAHRHTSLLRPSQWPQLLFPSIPAATLLALFPGAADALFDVARDGTDDAFGVIGVLCAAAVVAAAIGTATGAAAYLRNRRSSRLPQGSMAAKGEKTAYGLFAEEKDSEQFDAHSSEQPHFFSSMLAPKPSHTLTPFAGRSWAIPTLCGAAPTVRGLIIPTVLLCVHFGVIGVMCASEALAPGAADDVGFASLASMTNCGARGVAGGALLLALAAAIAALRPFSRAAIDVLTVVATATVGAALIVSGSEALGGYESSDVGGAAYIAKAALLMVASAACLLLAWRILPHGPRCTARDSDDHSSHSATTSRNLFPA